jgi:hypothetical protein
MKVKELIEELQKCDGELEVELVDENESTSFYLAHVKEEEEYVWVKGPDGKSSMQLSEKRKVFLS